ncbi:MAG: sulfatase [Verrucomicrobiota bacterium]
MLSLNTLIHTLIFVLSTTLLLNTTAAAKKNVLFIMADDFNYWTGKNGYYPQANTPRIDALADAGVFFTDAHSSSPVCHPSRNALWSGIHPIASGISRNGEPFIRDVPGFEDITSLHQYFAQNGYYTYGGGKLWHPGRMDPKNPHVDPANWRELNPQATGANGGGYKRFGLTSKSNYKWSGNREPMTLSNTNDFALATQTAAFIANYDNPKPFFVACGLFRPHMPWNSPKEFWDKIDSSNLAPPPGYDAISDEPGNRIHQEIVSNDKWQDAIHAYLAACALADHNVGVLLDALNASTHKDNTIIIFVGDHGWSLGEKGHWGKFSVNDEANHTTMIIYDPSSDGNGQSCRKSVSLQDLYPTLLELCGLAPNPTAQGNSLKQLLDNPKSAEWNKPIFMKYGNTEYMKTENYRFIEKGDDSELYHNPTDPYQRTNLYGKPRYASTVDWFRSLLADFKAEGETLKAALASAPAGGGPTAQEIDHD